MKHKTYIDSNSRVFLVAAFATSIFSFSLGQSQPLQAIAYDKVSGAFFQQMSDGAYKRVQGMPVISTSRPVQLKVLNVNKYKYKVTIKTSEFSDFTSVPPILDSILIPFAPLNLGIAKDLKLSSPNAMHINLFGADSGTKTNQFNDSVKKLTELLASLQKDFNLINDLKVSQQDLDEILKSVPDPQFMPDAFPSDPKQPGNLRAEELRAAVRNYLKSIQDQNLEASKSGGTTVRINPSGQTPISDQSAATVPQGTISQVAEQARKRISDRYTQVLEAYQQVQTSSGEIDALYTNPSIKSSDEDASRFAQGGIRSLDNIDRELEEKLELTKTAVQALQANQRVDSKLIARSSKLATEVLTEDPFEVAAEPISVQSDRIRFTITFEEVDSEEKEVRELVAAVDPAVTPLVAPQVNVDVKVVGKTKIDYSAGVFFTNLSDGNYSLDSNNVIRQGAKSNLTDGLGALVHVYKSSTATINPALSFGLMNSGGKTGYLLGLSAIVGDDQRFIFTAGLAFKEVKRLDGYSTGDTFNGSGAFTRDVFRSGLFFGVTFNLRN